MKKMSYVFTVLLFLIPSISIASTMTTAQVNAIIGLLQAFNVDQVVMHDVQHILDSSLLASIPNEQQISSVTHLNISLPNPHIPVVGSSYIASNLGYDLSYNTFAYPFGFNFGIVGITGGKAFIHNNRLVSEYSWAKFGLGAAPTFYMNLNAPYGSTVAGHISDPKLCTSDRATSTEPTACEGYNYGYNAARDAYNYAKNSGASSSLWWFDIEEANSWSPDPAVNDATIQGAIDYLNSKNTRVGIYSTPRMWEKIAGSDFVPTQTISGNTVSIPNWFPIGITNQVNATNACMTNTGFIVGSPVWLIQYEASSTAIDQNIAC